MPLPSSARLSPHFLASELGADHPSASSGIVDNLKRTADFLEVVRDALGSPLRVTSGYRPPAVNAAVGGSPTSSHQDGLAADVVPVDGQTLYSSYTKLQAAGLPSFDQIIFYPSKGHLHIGLGSQMRREFRISFGSEPGQTPLLTGGLIAALPGYVAEAGVAAVAGVRTVATAAQSNPTATAALVVGGVALYLLVT